MGWQTDYETGQSYWIDEGEASYDQGLALPTTYPEEDWTKQWVNQFDPVALGYIKDDQGNWVPPTTSPTGGLGGLLGGLGGTLQGLLGNKTFGSLATGLIPGLLSSWLGAKSQRAMAATGDVTKTQAMTPQDWAQLLPYVMTEQARKYAAEAEAERQRPTVTPEQAAIWGRLSEAMMGPTGRTPEEQQAYDYYNQLAQQGYTPPGAIQALQTIQQQRALTPQTLRDQLAETMDWSRNRGGVQEQIMGEALARLQMEQLAREASQQNVIGQYQAQNPALQSAALQQMQNLSLNPSTIAQKLQVLGYPEEQRKAQIGWARGLEQTPLQIQQYLTGLGYGTPAASQARTQYNIPAASDFFMKNISDVIGKTGQSTLGSWFNLPAQTPPTVATAATAATAGK